MYETSPLNNARDVLVSELISLFLLVSAPVFTAFYSISWHDFGSSLSRALQTLCSDGPVKFFIERFPPPTHETMTVYFAWIGIQAALFAWLPGRVHLGPRTSGGRRLQYNLNGFTAWIVTVLAAASAASFSIIDPAYIGKNWGALLASANVYCFLLILFFWFKARIRPDHPGETYISGHFFYDLFNGGEQFPRTGQMFDWKHFNCSRTGGMILWTLIDLSFAALERELKGQVSRAMVLAVAFRMFIVAEYFWYEHWFLETLDSCHERFSFYSIYGFAVVMPQLYTLQTQYLATTSFELSPPAAVICTLTFGLGWAIQHVANEQKSASRAHRGECVIWGQRACYIEAQYTTSDGKSHTSVLLCSGFWGHVRHANYVGSLIYTTTSCAVCGLSQVFPWAEALAVFFITVHRCFRDESRCARKYGKHWDEYCRRVRWRMIPGVY